MNPVVPGLNYSFSGLKTSFMYLVRDELKKDPDFIKNNTNDLCASIQKAIIGTLMKKLLKASSDTGIKVIALAGGVSANSALRNEVSKLADSGYEVFIPPFEYCTDNAAMIAITGYFKFKAGLFSSLHTGSLARYKLD